MPGSPKGNTKAKKEPTAEEREAETKRFQKNAVDAVPTRASDWGKKSKTRTDDPEGFVVELPSGEFAKVRRTMDLPTLLRSGQIPNPLAGIIRKAMTAEDPALVQEIMQKNLEPGTMMEQFLQLLDSTCIKTMIEPKVSRPEPQRPGEEWDDYMARIEGWQPEEGTVSVFDIEMNDKLFLFAVAQGMAADLVSFRAQTSAVVVGVQDGEDVQRAPKRTARTGGGKSKPRSRAGA